MKISFSDEVSGASHFGKAIVALESTVIAHGLPHPQNIDTAKKLEKIVHERGATPATIAVLDGEVHVGLNPKQLELLATAKDIRKISRRDLPLTVVKKSNGATTVAATCFIAQAAGINVLATGGIGGVHRGTHMDVSADLPTLAQVPTIVVCSGVKSVLDLPRTREWLETHGVTVLGWQCDEMPAFYSRKSGLSVDATVADGFQVASIADSRNELGLRNALLVTVPVPEAFDMPAAELEKLLMASLKAAEAAGIRGKDITPFLLTKMFEISGGRTLASNVALLENNARVAAEIALALNY